MLQGCVARCIDQEKVLEDLIKEIRTRVEQLQRFEREVLNTSSYGGRRRPKLDLLVRVIERQRLVEKSWEKWRRLMDDLYYRRSSSSGRDDSVIYLS